MQYEKAYAALEAVMTTESSTNTDTDHLPEKHSHPLNGPVPSTENTEEFNVSLESNEKAEPLLGRNGDPGNRPVNEKHSLSGPVNGKVSGEKQSAEGGMVVRKYTLMDVIKTKVLLKTALIICFLW